MKRVGSNELNLSPRFIHSASADYEYQGDKWVLQSFAGFHDTFNIFTFSKFY